MVNDKKRSAERQTNTPDKDRLPKAGDEIKVMDNKYKLLEVLGEGGYGCVFLSKIGEKKIAMKTEKFSSSMLHIEVNVLKAAAKAKCFHLCELFDYGSCKPDYVFMAMTLLHKDLHNLRYDQPNRKFSLSTSLRLCIQAFEAIEELHSIGYLSRDVKPGNFAPGTAENKQNKILFMYDFGLARKYRDKNNSVIASRKEIGWRGTTRYASLNAHLKLDLGRRDDLESWFYMLVEITKGILPWRLVPERNDVEKLKMAARNTGKEAFFTDCPKQYESIMKLIDGMTFETNPDYEKIAKILHAIRKEQDIHLYEHWDWEEYLTFDRIISNEFQLFSNDQELFRTGVTGDNRSRESANCALNTPNCFSILDGIITQAEDGFSAEIAEPEGTAPQPPGGNQGSQENQSAQVKNSLIQASQITQIPQPPKIPGSQEPQGAPGRKANIQGSKEQLSQASQITQIPLPPNMSPVQGSNEPPGPPGRKANIQGSKEQLSQASQITQIPLPPNMSPVQGFHEPPGPPGRKANIQGSKEQLGQSSQITQIPLPPNMSPVQGSHDTHGPPGRKTHIQGSREPLSPQPRKHVVAGSREPTHQPRKANVHASKETLSPQPKKGNVIASKEPISPVPHRRPVRVQDSQEPHPQELPRAVAAQKLKAAK